MKKYIAMAAVILAATVSCNKSGVEGNDVDLENISSDVNSLYVIQSGLTADPDGFNMLTDGGFERFAGSGEWKDKSLFWLNEDIAESEEPCTGSRSIRLFFDGEGWKDLAIQTVNLKKGQSYTLSLNYRAAWKGCNCYMGFRATETHDQNTNDPERNDAWDEGYSYTWENIDDIQADVFFGGFWWYNLWAELDDMRVIPTGSSNDSFIPANAGITAQSIPSAAKTVVESAERAVFSTDGTSGMLHNAVISGETVENVYVTSAFNKAGKLVIATAEATDIKGFIPTAVVKTDGVVYIHGYSEIVPGGQKMKPQPFRVPPFCPLLMERHGKQQWSYLKTPILQRQHSAKTAIMSIFTVLRQTKMQGTPILPACPQHQSAIQENMNIGTVKPISREVKKSQRASSTVLQTT